MEHPAPERQERHASPAGGGRSRVVRGDRSRPVRRGAEQERGGAGRAERREEQGVVPYGGDRADVREQHLTGERDDEDHDRRPDQPVGGALADLADDGEEHPQELVLPGGRGDGHDDAPGHGDGEEQLPVPGVADRAAHADEGDGGGQHEEQGDLDRSFQAEPEQRAVQGLVGEAVRPLTEPGTRHMVDPVRPRVLRHRGPGGGRAEGEGGEEAAEARRLPVSQRRTAKSRSVGWRAAARPTRTPAAGRPGLRTRRAAPAGPAGCWSGRGGGCCGPAATA